MHSFRSELNRALFAVAYIKVLLDVWQTFDPNPIFFLNFAIVLAIFTTLFDKAIDWVLRKLDKPLNKAAKPVAAALVLAFLFVTPFPVPFTIHIAGTVIVIALISKSWSSIIPVECFEELISRHIWVDYYPSFKALFSHFTLPPFFSRHGAYDLFPLKMSLLFYQ